MCDVEKVLFFDMAGSFISETNVTTNRSLVLVSLAICIQLALECLRSAVLAKEVRSLHLYTCTDPRATGGRTVLAEIYWMCVSLNSLMCGKQQCKFALDCILIIFYLMRERALWTMDIQILWACVWIMLPFNGKSVRSCRFYSHTSFWILRNSVVLADAPEHSE